MTREPQDQVECALFREVNLCLRTDAVPTCRLTSRAAIFRRCLTSIGIGQFARLLPTLVVVAVSQAPSPEPNTDPPLPVMAMVVHYTTIAA